MSILPQVEQKRDESSVLQKAKSRQSLASNPLYHAWVSASAGTGKTKVLTDRVLRLLLPSRNRKATSPEKILCITFTKAAAAEMESRIYDVLSQWTELDDDSLKAALTDLMQEEITPDIMKEARRLFARIVDTSGGMKILTLHSFCQSVLKKFPIEAGLNPAFEVIDERSAREILQFVVDTLFYATQQSEENEFTKAIDYLAGVLNEDQFNDVVKTLVRERQMFYRLFKQKDLEGLIEEIFKKIHLDRKKTEKDYVREFCSEVDWEKIKCFIIALAGGSEAEQKKVPNLQYAVENKSNDEIVYRNLKSFLLKSDGESIRQNPINKKTIEKQPVDVGIYLEEIKESIYHTKETIKSLSLAESSKAFLTVADIVIKLYQEEKRRNNFLDYDDLIDYTVELLNEAGQSAWVLYKLDGGIDHILVDEAQDTSAEQWKVIQALTSEFFAGEGKEREDTRTLFVVGDEKQSIYSFQKADPYEFIRMRDFFKDKIQKSSQIFQSIQLQVSFRSTRSVLSFVDSVFLDDNVAKGVLFDDNPMEHLVFRQGHAGHVELWPMASIRKEKTEESGWSIPLEPQDKEDSNSVLARKIAKTIRKWIDEKEILPSQGRPVKPSDIMILLRKRGKLMQDIVSALKAYDIPISGVDRLNLKEQLCVQDMLALVSFVLQPHDDLNLACLLKSPLLGCNDDDLMKIALGRGMASLWDSLKNKENYQQQYIYLKDFLIKHNTKRPFEFFSYALSLKVPYGFMNGKKAILSRLGGEALDPLDELLNLALHYEQNHCASLQSFLDWIIKDDFEIKREMNKELGTVSIMTVHGSKGLQAPIVFMADSTLDLDGKKLNKNLIWYDGLPLWAPRKDFKSQIFSDIEDNIKEKEKEEYRRLLYVGLTRAEDRLYICGASKKDTIKEDSWYDYAQKTIMAFENVEEKNWEEDKEYWHDDKFYCLSYGQEVPASFKNEKENIFHEENLPDWIGVPVVQQEEVSRPLKPSKPDEDLLPVFSPLDEVEEDEIRFSRGLLIHSLLEFLPNLAPEKREMAATSYIQKQKPAWGMSKINYIVQEVLGILNHREFGEVFGECSKAEVSISGLIESRKQGKSFVLSGKIDRLIIKEREVLIVDYKTNRPAAERAEDIPVAYLKQMALYREVLQKIYPDKEIKTALLWTDITKLMILPSGLLDDHRP